METDQSAFMLYSRLPIARHVHVLHLACDVGYYYCCARERGHVRMAGKYCALLQN
jgi:hypothetical protein